MVRVCICKWTSQGKPKTALFFLKKTLSREGEEEAASLASKSGERKRIEREEAAGRRDQEEEITEMSTPVTEEDLCETTSRSLKRNALP